MASMRTSQQGFDSLVMENINDLGMDPAEALDDAIQTLKLQGADLSGIIMGITGVSSAKENPVISALNTLKAACDELELHGVQNADVDTEKMADLLDTLYGLCSTGGSENTAIAVRNGGVELTTSICSILVSHGMQKERLVWL